VVCFCGFDQAGGLLRLIGVWDQAVRFGVDLVRTTNRVAGGLYGPFDPQDIVEEPRGSLWLCLADCTSGQARLQSENGEQTLNIRLLAGSFCLNYESRSR
jgi:hypothetical protein